MAKIQGECLCGKIKYQLAGPTGNLVHCHCSQCRKWHGAAFRSRVVAQEKDFTWLQGEDQLSYYSATPNITKTFCRHCGSNLITLYPSRPGMIGIPIAGAEVDLDTHQEFHIFVGSKARWFSITDALPRYETLPDDASRVHGLNT